GVRSAGAARVGFDLGLGTFTDGVVIYALRPIYLTQRGEVTAEVYGLFADAPGKKGEVLRTKVTRQVHIQARPGYAVGAVTLQTKQYIEALCLTFMRMRDGALDPAESSHGQWVGNPVDGRSQMLSVGGNPIVGIFGGRDEHDVRALGLCYIKSWSKAAAAIEPPPLPSESAAILPGGTGAKAEDQPAKQG